MHQINNLLYRKKMTFTYPSDCKAGAREKAALFGAPKGTSFASEVAGVSLTEGGKLALNPRLPLNLASYPKHPLPKVSPQWN